MNLLFQWAEIGSSFLDALMCYFFVQLFMPEKPKAKAWFFFLSAILLATTQLARHYQVFPFLSTLWFVFFICITTVVLFQVNAFYAISLVSFYILCLYTLDFFCLSTMGVLSKNQEFARMVIGQLSLWRCAYLAVDKVLLALFYLLARKALKRKLLYHAKMLFVVSLLGLFGVGFLSWLTIQATTVHSLFSWGLCLLLLLLAYFALLYYTMYKKEKEVTQALQLKDQMVHREYKLLSEQQKKQETLSHDLKNHFLVLSSLLSEKEYGKAAAYINGLGEPLEKLSSEMWTGNATLDLLLNHSRNRCALNGIPFTIQADALPLDAMDDQDICCLFANLLDNAWEAASKMPEGEGWIHVKLRKANQMVFFEISNALGSAPKLHGGRLISSKDQPLLHGLGTCSAARAAAKYGGELEYAFGDGAFRVRGAFLEGMGRGE